MAMRIATETRKKIRPFAELALSGKSRFFTEFTLSGLKSRFFASLRMTAKGLRMTAKGLRMTAKDSG